jgi:hypothetical protein
MVTIRDILNREKWASKTGLTGLAVEVLHRGAPGDTKVIKGESIADIAPRAMLVREEGEDTAIPYHRVRIIRRGDTVIWRKAPKEK